MATSLGNKDGAAAERYRRLTHLGSGSFVLENQLLEYRGNTALTRLDEMLDGIGAFIRARYPSG